MKKSSNVLSPADKILLSRVLAGAAAAGGLTGLIRGYLSYVGASTDEDEKLSDSKKLIQVPLQAREDKVRKSRNKLNPEVFMQPQDSEENVEASGGEPSVNSQSSEELEYGWGDDTARKEASNSGPVSVAIGEPSLLAAVSALPLAVMGFQGSEFLSSKLLSLAKKNEIKRQLAEAEVAYLRALEAEKKQMREKTASLSTWTPETAVLLGLAGIPGLAAWLSAQASDRLLSSAFPPLKRELPVSNRVERIELPPADVLEEDGDPAENMVIKAASFLKIPDAEEFMFRVAMEMPSNSSAFLGDLVKCASSGGVRLLEEALAVEPEAMWKLASEFRRMELDPAERALGLSLISRSAVRPVAVMHAAAVLHDFSPTMHKFARKMSVTNPNIGPMMEGAAACLGVLCRVADLKGVLDFPVTPLDTLRKAASSVDRSDEIDMIHSLLCTL